MLGLALVFACGGTVTVPGDAGSGGDASLDATSGGDAPADAGKDVADAASQCPAVRPQRLTPCSPVDALCVYPCGIAMRCGAGGWDYDTTFDAGPPCP